MRRLASIISAKAERIPKYLDARLKQTEAMASPSSLGFLKKLDLLPQSPQATLQKTGLLPEPAQVTPPATQSLEATAPEGILATVGKMAEMAAPVAALVGEPEAAAAATVIDEAVTKLQTVLAKPSANKAAQPESAKPSPETASNPSSPVSSRVEEVSANNEASSETPAANESSVTSETPDRSPQAWAARIRKMIEAETGASKNTPTAAPLVSVAQTQLENMAANIGDVSTTLASAIPAVAPLSAALGEARRFVPPIADGGLLSQAVQPTSVAIPFSMQTAEQTVTKAAPDIEAGVSKVIAPIAETVESPVAQINQLNQQFTQASNQVTNQVANQVTGALQQAASLPASATEGIADLASSINRRFVPPIALPILDATLPAQAWGAIPQMPPSLPGGVESLANDSVQSAAQTGEEFVAQSGMDSSASGVSNEGLAGIPKPFVGRTKNSSEWPEFSQMEVLKQWTEAANPAADGAALFGQAKSQANAKSPPTESDAATPNDKMTTATRATSARVAPDLDDIARQVYPILKRRLDAERRRELF